jgi:site-specific recombinase XerD
VEEYQRLLKAAKEKGDLQILSIMETIASTGIRISELPFITVASVSTRRALVSLKGKSRQVLIPAELSKKLRLYCRERKITSGSIFVTRTGRPMDRSNILHRMKALSTAAKVNREKIFPHNLRHFFAVNYYKAEKDIVRLADLLGHANINTTRIYTLISSESQLDILDKVEKSLHAV